MNGMSNTRTEIIKTKNKNSNKKKRRTETIKQLTNRKKALNRYVIAKIIALPPPQRALKQNLFIP